MEEGEGEGDADHLAGRFEEERAKRSFQERETTKGTMKMLNQFIDALIAE